MSEEAIQKEKLKRKGFTNKEAILLIEGQKRLKMKREIDKLVSKYE